MSDWDAERNVDEFLAVMPTWRAHGLLAVTVNLQGGSPEGYSRDQPWHNSGFEADGRLRGDYLDRLARVIERAHELGMVIILGLFYFGQDRRLRDEQAVVRATGRGGYFAPYADGYQSPPVSWEIDTDRKRSFFDLVREITAAG